MRRLSDVIFNRHPLTMPLSATVKDACIRMHERRVGSVLVTDDAEALVGIFTGRDAVCRVLAQGKDAAATSLSEVMTKNPETMSPDKTAIDALRLMWDGGFRHIPVMRGGKVAGIVSKGDFKALEHSRLEEERELWEHLR